MLTQKRLQELVHYCPQSGSFTRKIVTSRNSKAGAKIGYDHKGYLRAMLDNREYALHRLAWLYVYGEWPQGELDHINRDRSDNRISNLRLATSQQNNCNTKIRTDNSSGFKGVYFHKKAGKWLAAIICKRERYHLGLFVCPLDAASAYNLAAHKLHGEFASYNEPEGEVIVFA
jgi:hypothetical protein